jgi:hypothetical protein
MWMSPTRLTGLACYLMSAIICGLIFRRERLSSHSFRLSAGLAVLEVGLCFDLLLSGRLVVHDFLEQAAINNHLYGSRSEVQIPAPVLLALGVAMSVGYIVVRFRRRLGAALAFCGALLAVGCWFSEVISLHSLDAFYYAELGGVMRVAYLWLLCSLMMALGVALDSPSAGRGSIYSGRASSGFAGSGSETVTVSSADD